MHKSRLRWQCRRGMRELDELLLAYLERHYDGGDSDEKAAFRRLLDLSDPELMGYLLQHDRPVAEAMARVITRILDRTAS